MLSRVSLPKVPSTPSLSLIRFYTLAPVQGTFVQGTAGVRTVLVWDLGVSWTRGGGGKEWQ